MTGFICIAAGEAKLKCNRKNQKQNGDRRTHRPPAAVPEIGGKIAALVEVVEESAKEDRESHQVALVQECRPLGFPGEDAKASASAAQATITQSGPSSNRMSAAKAIVPQ